MTPKQKDMNIQSMTQKTGMGATEPSVAIVSGHGEERERVPKRLGPSPQRHPWLVSRLMSNFKDSSNKLANGPVESVQQGGSDKPHERIQVDSESTLYCFKVTAGAR